MDDEEVHLTKVPILTPSADELTLMALGVWPVRFVTKEEIEREFPSRPTKAREI